MDHRSFKVSNRNQCISSRFGNNCVTHGSDQFRSQNKRDCFLEMKTMNYQLILHLKAGSSFSMCAWLYSLTHLPELHGEIEVFFENFFN